MTIDKSEFQAQAPSLWVPIYLANIRKQASIKALFWGEENHLRRWAMRDSQRSSIKAKTKLAYWECSDEPSRNHTAQACSASFYPSPPFLWLTWDFRRWTAALRSQIQNQAEESWSHFFPTYSNRSCLWVQAQKYHIRLEKERIHTHVLASIRGHSWKAPSRILGAFHCPVVQTQTDLQEFTASLSQNCSPGHSLPFPLSSLLSIPLSATKNMAKDGKWLTGSDCHTFCLPPPMSLACLHVSLYWETPQ